jgi:hypothetical protein
MTSSFRRGELRSRFDRAIRDEDLPGAWSAAGKLREVELDRALGLTLLLGRKGDLRFRRTALRFIARLALEAQPTLEQVKNVADALTTLERVCDLPGMREGADRALEDLQRQLRARGR